MDERDQPAKDDDLGDANPSPEDDATLSAYGDAVDLVARVPTVTGALVAALGAGVVWIVRSAWRRRHRS